MVAFVADDNGVGVVVTGGVMQHERRTFRTGHPAITPGRHGRKNREDVATLLREAVLAT